MLTCGQPWFLSAKVSNAKSWRWSTRVLWRIDQETKKSIVVNSENQGQKSTLWLLLEASKTQLRRFLVSLCKQCPYSFSNTFLTSFPKTSFIKVDHIIPLWLIYLFPAEDPHQLTKDIKIPKEVKLREKVKHREGEMSLHQALSDTILRQPPSTEYP